LRRSAHCEGQRGRGAGQLHRAIVNLRKHFKHITAENSIMSMNEMNMKDILSGVGTGTSLMRRIRRCSSAASSRSSMRPGTNNVAKKATFWNRFVGIEHCEQPRRQRSLSRRRLGRGVIKHFVFDKQESRQTAVNLQIRRRETALMTR